MKVLKIALIVGGILIAACVVLALIVAPTTPSTTQQQPTLRPAQVEPAAQATPMQPVAQPVNTDQPTVQPTIAPSPIVLTGNAIKCAPSVIYKAKPDTKLAGVLVSIKNNSAETINVNPLSFELVDTDGYVYRSVLASCDGQLDTTKLSPGTAIRGEVGFELPPSAVPKSIKFSVDAFGQNSITVDLTQ